MKLYVAGPMSNRPHHGYPAFHIAEEELRAAGYDVVNPARLDAQTPWDDSRERWGDCIVRDIAALNTCDGLALLPGWMNSPGAQVEHVFAEGKQIPIAYVDYWLEVTEMKEEFGNV